MIDDEDEYDDGYGDDEDDEEAGPYARVNRWASAANSHSTMALIFSSDAALEAWNDREQRMVELFNEASEHHRALARIYSAMSAIGSQIADGYVQDNE